MADVIGREVINRISILVAPLRQVTMVIITTKARARATTPTITITIIYF